MAVTSIWAVRHSVKDLLDYTVNPDKTENPNADDLKKLMDYAQNSEKTEQKFLISGINCLPELAYERMMETKRRYGKYGGIVAYHGYQSFKPGEVTPEQCHVLGVELAKRLWGDRYEVLVASHSDHDHLHNHFVINSVSFKNGGKFHCPPYYHDLVMAPESDKLCLEHGLSVIGNPQRKRMPYVAYMAEKSGKPSHRSLLKFDIDDAIADCIAPQYFRYALQMRGYTYVRDEHYKHPCVMAKGWKRPVRIDSLGVRYTPKAIERRILCHREYQGRYMPGRPPLYGILKSKKCHEQPSTFVENGVKDGKRAEVAAYFTEYAESLDIDFVTFEDMNLKVNLSDSKKKLQTAAKAFLDGIESGLKMIATFQEHSDEIMAEFKRNGFDASAAVVTISNRHKAIEREQRIAEERKQREAEHAAHEARLQAELEAQAATMSQNEPISAPVSVEAPTEQKPVESGNGVSAEFSAPEDTYMRLFSTEQVSKYHPDKVCDQISDAILDACLAEDPKSRVACETLFKEKTIIIAGEITTKANVCYERVARNTAAKLGYECDSILNLISTQSPEIAKGVGDGEEQGAGDQGMMYGYACNETESMLPFGFDLANRIIKAIEDDINESGEYSFYRGDAKCQVTVDLDETPDMRSVKKILVSVCHSPYHSVHEVREFTKRLLLYLGIPDTVEIIINPAGEWTLGGPRADCGLTGRKIVCDQYGGYCAVGGGAFSGKDPSKVDRSAAYFARALACKFVDLFELKECEVQLAYAIGQAEPVSVSVKCILPDGTADEGLGAEIERTISTEYDLTPHGIIEQLDLIKPQYERIAGGCHYRTDRWRL